MISTPVLRPLAGVAAHGALRCGAVQGGAVRCNAVQGALHGGRCVCGVGSGRQGSRAHAARQCTSQDLLLRPPEDLLFHGFLDLFASGFVGVIGPVKNP